jgi:hypothetical protein
MSERSRSSGPENAETSTMKLPSVGVEEISAEGA